MELNDIPLPKFSAEQLNRYQPQSSRVPAKQPQGQAKPPQVQVDQPWSPSVPEQPPSAALLNAITRSDLICSTLEQELTLEQAQEELGKVLDRAESLLAQVVSEHW